MVTWEETFLLQFHHFDLGLHRTPLSQTDLDKKKKCFIIKSKKNKNKKKNKNRKSALIQEKYTSLPLYNLNGIDKSCSSISRGCLQDMSTVENTTTVHVNLIKTEQNLSDSDSDLAC